ncbi:RHS repeat-associated core domain-containing protein [Litoribacter ruber]|nr:RHS repeat-associated core domain-containing protein [Litoribacter ruber]MBT0813139.1 RHS repeat-associated core domain-containing protein [Litoribacter ruber]
MAIYEVDSLTEQSIYGSSRLGIQVASSQQGYRNLGGKRYELSNHLGNVLAVVSDNIHQSSDSTWAEIINLTDYYPFGLAMEGRAYQDSLSYRYGFNGKENDSETGTQDYGFRIYDPKIAKFLSVDPLTKSYPMLTPYQFASNRPIDGIDLDGLEYWNSTSIYSEGINVAVGNFYGFNLGISNGTAWDMIGKTQFKTYTAVWPGNQNLSESSTNPKIIGGAEIGIDGGFNFAYKKPTFSKAMEAIGMSMSTVSAKWGLGGSVQFGKNLFGIRVGYGIGGSFKSGDQSVVFESISISNSEASKIRLGEDWILSEPSFYRNSQEGSIRAESQIIIDGKGSGIKVYSNAVESVNDSGSLEYKPDGIWKSRSYFEKEKEYK